MDYNERLMERKKMDILKSINSNLSSIDRRLGEIEKTLRENGFAVIPSVLADHLENIDETTD